MNTSSRFVVAVHILVAMTLAQALRKLDCLTSDFLGASVNTNPVVIRRIISRLRKAGLVDSQPGAGGGSMLARDPEHLTLQEVYEAVEAGDLFHLHYSEPNPYCPIGANIQTALKGTLEAAETSMLQSLAQTTVASIAEKLKEPAMAYLATQETAEISVDQTG
jgi:DNA-binding IscR family transcriptional regulator